MNNLFISYDLNAPGQRYEAVAAAIKTLGNWAKLQKSFWYVKSSCTAAQAVDRVWAAMDRNDSVIVVDATNRQAAWKGIDPTVAQHILDNWEK